MGNIDSKLDTVIRLVQTGMDRYRSMLLAELTDEEIALYEKDTAFATKLDFAELRMERDLLDKLDMIVDINTERGISTEVRFLLSKINPDRWGAKRDAPVPPSGPLPITIVPASISVDDAPCADDDEAFPL
jgi:hypothetical protein